MRVSYWDNWKGIAIIAVIAIHASNGTATFQEGSFNWLFGLTLRQFIDFAVPFFLAMSGYFSAKVSNESLLSFYKGRFIRILIPYLIWTAIYLLAKTPTILPSLSECFQGVFFGTGIGIGYFVIVLSQFVILTPLFAKIQKKWHHVAIMITISIMGSIFVYYFSAINTDHFLSQFPAYALPFFAWYPFYHSGYFMARYKNELKLNSTLIKTATFGLALSLTLSLCEGLFWAYNHNYSFGVSQLKATSLAASLFLFILAVSLSEKKTLLHRYSAITWLGENSYVIYLSHMLFLTIIQKILRQSDSIYSLQPLTILLSVALSLILCTGLIKTCSKILPRNISKHLLGN